MSDAVFDLPRERELTRPGRPSSLGLLRRRDFRLLFCAVATSEIGAAACATAAVGVAGALLRDAPRPNRAPERA